jgi:hypothetical protein
VGLRVGLGGFVVDSGYDFVFDFRGNPAHFVSGARMFGDLSKNVLFTVAAGNKITVRADVSATHSFWHGTSFWREV